MNISDLRRLHMAPEIIVVDLADAALVALRRGILLQHPVLRDGLSAERSLVLRRAARVLRAAARLRRALRAYRHGLDRVLDEPPQDDLPF